MNCFYCDKIVAIDPEYVAAAAAFDLGSDAPRCGRHWRYVCGQCGKPAHFMAVAFCPRTGKCFCARCATARREVVAQYWAWGYYFELQSPWSGQWLPALDRLEFEGQLPADVPGRSEEPWLTRYPETPVQWRSSRECTDADVQAKWNANAQRWTGCARGAGGQSDRQYEGVGPTVPQQPRPETAEVLPFGMTARRPPRPAGGRNGDLCNKDGPRYSAPKGRSIPAQGNALGNPSTARIEP
jgi:hypothetical protein